MATVQTTEEVNVLDWISTFLSLTKDSFSPEPFRLWAGLSTIAAALDQRIYTRTRGTRPARPNLFVCLAGESGSGKTEALNFSRSLLGKVRGIRLAPTNCTNAAFYDVLSESFRPPEFTNGSGSLELPHSLNVLCRECGTFFPHYDQGFLSDLSDIYDNPPIFDARRRTSKSVEIERPSVNILLCATPKYLGELLPELAWGQGFCSRMIFIHSHSEPLLDSDMFVPGIDPDTTQLLPRLKEIFMLHGEVEWSEKARVEFNAWYNANMPPRPTHSRLHEYCTRRHMHVIKLSMISAVSAERDLFIELEDFERGLDWLLEAEKTMPDVFRAMGAKSDSQIIHDLHYHLYVMYHRVAINDRKPIQEQVLYRFLEDKAESFKHKNLIEAAERSGYIRRGTYPGEWIPETQEKVSRL